MYIQVENNKLVAWGPYPFEGYTDISPIDYEQYNNNPEKYMFDEIAGEIVKDPLYEEKQKQKEKERIAKLSMTKYDFFKYVCAPYGVTYAKLNEFVSSSDEVAAAWNLCAKVYRGDETLCAYIKVFIPVMTDSKLDEIFKTYGE